MPRAYKIPTRYRRRPYSITKSDKQKIINAIWSWFIDQKHPACTIRHAGENVCAYRNEDETNACAVGIFFPSCVPPDVLGYMGPITLFREKHSKTLDRIFDPGLIPFLQDLQTWHDQWLRNFTPHAQSELTAIINAHGLAIPGDNS